MFLFSHFFLLLFSDKQRSVEKLKWIRIEEIKEWKKLKKEKSLDKKKFTKKLWFYLSIQKCLCSFFVDFGMHLLFCYMNLFLSRRAFLEAMIFFWLGWNRSSKVYSMLVFIRHKIYYIFFLFCRFRLFYDYWKFTHFIWTFFFVLFSAHEAQQQQIHHHHGNIFHQWLAPFAFICKSNRETGVKN